jgi:hypothetical protein
MKLRYDRRAIMSRAWEYFRAQQERGHGPLRTLAECLGDAWVAARYDAYAWRYGYSTDISLIFIIDA